MSYKNPRLYKCIYHNDISKTIQPKAQPIAPPKNPPKAPPKTETNDSKFTRLIDQYVEKNDKSNLENR